MFEQDSREKETKVTRKDFLKYSAGAAATIALGSLHNLTYAEDKSGPASSDVIDDLLKGAIDMHVYTSPDVIPT